LAKQGAEFVLPVRSLSAKTEALSAKYGQQVSFVVFDSTQDLKPQFEKFATGLTHIVHSSYYSGPQDTEVENQVIDGLLSAAKVTAQNSLTVAIFTSGCLTVADSDTPLEDGEASEETAGFAKNRVAIEKKVIAANSHNLHVSLVRPAWVYGGSFIDQYLSAVKKTGKIVFPAANGRILLVASEDLAEAYRVILNAAGTGYFNIAEPHSLTSSEYLELVKKLTGVENVERVENLWPEIQTYSFAVLAPSFNKNIAPKRIQELGYKAKYEFVRDAASIIQF